MTRRVAAALLCVGVLAGCGADGDDEPVRTIRGASGAPAVTAPDMCDVLAPAEVGPVLGGPVTAATVQQTCEFRLEGDPAVAAGIGSALATDLGGSVETLAQRVEAASITDAVRSDPGIGAESFVLVGRDPSGESVRAFAAARGDDGIVVTVTLVPAIPAETDDVARQATDLLALAHGGRSDSGAGGR